MSLVKECGGFARGRSSSEIFRARCYSAALGVIPHHPSLGDDARMWRVLRQAFCRIGVVRPGFSSHDYVLYVLALLSESCDVPVEVVTALREAALDLVKRARGSIAPDLVAVAEEADETGTTQRFPLFRSVRENAPEPLPTMVIAQPRREAPAPRVSNEFLAAFESLRPSLIRVATPRDPIGPSGGTGRRDHSAGRPS